MNVKRDRRTAPPKDLTLEERRKEIGRLENTINRLTVGIERAQRRLDELRKASR